MSKDPSERFLETAAAAKFPDCTWPKHHIRATRSCPAFPDGVPIDIRRARVKHRTVRPDQVGDYVYTPEERARCSRTP